MQLSAYEFCSLNFLFDRLFIIFPPPGKSELPGGSPSGVSTTVGEYQLEALFWQEPKLVHHVTCLLAKRHSILRRSASLRSEDLLQSGCVSWLHCLSNCSFRDFCPGDLFFSWTVTRGLIPGLPKELRSVTCFFFFIGLPKIMPYYFNSY